MKTLPVDAVIPGAVEALRSGRNLVLEAPPGAGKTTRVPPALLPLATGEVWVLEPRRLAVRMAARRVAFEMDEQPGETVGYQVRFEQVGGRRTRLRFLTEGVLTRRFLSDPELRAAATVVLDEFHERHLDGDLALALLRNLQRGRRPDLRIVVMSATIDAAPIARYLGDCPAVRSEGRLYDLSIRYTPHSAAPIEEQAAAALQRLLAEGLDGDVLVFLPGAAEIRRAARAVEPIAARANLLVLPLYGDLSPEEQDRAVQPAARRKVILSTNVAESSVTIEGVTAVIDSGLARIASDSPWTGLPALRIARVSQASARQRAGRAGRTAPGRVIRLYPEDDFLRRPAQDAPEILRRELSEAALTLRAMGVRGFDTLEWLDDPPEAAARAADELLRRLGAVAPDGSLTAVGRWMASLPLPPRLARLAIEADRQGAGQAGCVLAAILSTERAPAPSDVPALLEAERQPATRQLANLIRSTLAPAHGHGSDDALRIATLTAFPDRVARRRGADEVRLCGGGSAILASSNLARGAELLVAVDIEERKERGLPLVRLACVIQPEWLLDMYPERVHARETMEWNRAAERVEAASALLYDDLVIEESRGGSADAEGAGRLLAEKALEAGVARFADAEDLEHFLARLSFAALYAPLPSMGEAEVQEELAALCQGLRSFAQLADAAGNGGLTRRLEQRLTAAQARLLDEVAPPRLRLPGGRQARVVYHRDKPPSVASRLQDFFGLKETPRVARGAVPVVLELLAPNQRPVQTTTDLAGFWERLYPQVRRELSRRYPRHKWPESPV